MALKVVGPLALFDNSHFSLFSRKTNLSSFKFKGELGKFLIYFRKITQWWASYFSKVTSFSY